jgi:hypothetical protein
MLGTSILRHPFAAAIPATVEGPAAAHISSSSRNMAQIVAVNPPKTEMIFLLTKGGTTGTGITLSDIAYTI